MIKEFFLRLRSNALSILSIILLVIATISIESSCWLFFHQPELPESMKKTDV